MITITERFDQSSATYDIVDDEQRTRTVSTTCYRTTLNGVDTFVFRDYEKRIMMPPSCFVTLELSGESRNTRSQTVSAMKALMNFCAIMGTPFEAFDISLARACVQFIRGTLSEGVVYRFETHTMRGEETVGAYLKHIRRYARWLNVDNSPFLQPKHTVVLNGMGMSFPQDETHRLKADVVKKTEAPRYISVPDYKKILSVIDEKWSIEERIIIRLMFEHGLRIGEVLGLTLEDLDQSSYRDGTPKYSVLLRNRASDNDDQHAKTLMNAGSRKVYGLPDYRTQGVGTKSIYISEDLYEQIIDYVESIPFGSLPRVAKSEADSVSGMEENRYIFLNTLGAPLSQNLWNKRLRRIMTDAGAHVDVGRRRTNLNHRFRHGYAMYIIYEARQNGVPLDEFQIKTLMRHRSIESTEAYQRPTEHDIWMPSEEISEKLGGELRG